MRSPLNIAICGCGPAGLAAALLLHADGHRVCIFDRFAAPGPVGSGLILQPTGLGVLAKLGLVDAVARQGARIERLFGRVVPSNRIVLDVRYRALGEHYHAIAVHRATLFDALHTAAVSAGIELTSATTISRVTMRHEQPVVFDAQDRSLGEYDLIVDALGAYSALSAARVSKNPLAYGALWANVVWPTSGGFDFNALEQRYRRASRMAGILPIGVPSTGHPAQAAFFWSLKRAELAAWRSAGLQSWKNDVLRLWPQTEAFLEQIIDAQQLTFAQYDHFTLRQPFARGLVHIGDAAHATSPQLGQGANMALLDAYALALALRTTHGVGGALRAYASMRRRHVRLFQRASAIFTPFYQSDSRSLPIMRDWLTAPLSNLPAADALLARLVSGMTTPPIAGRPFTPWRAHGAA